MESLQRFIVFRSGPGLSLWTRRLSSRAQQRLRDPDGPRTTTRSIDRKLLTDTRDGIELHIHASAGRAAAIVVVRIRPCVPAVLSRRDISPNAVASSSIITV